MGDLNLVTSEELLVLGVFLMVVIAGMAGALFASAYWLDRRERDLARGTEDRLGRRY